MPPRHPRARSRSPGAERHEVNVPSFGDKGFLCRSQMGNFPPTLWKQSEVLFLCLRRQLLPRAPFNHSSAAQDLQSAVPFPKDALLARRVGRAQHGGAAREGLSRRAAGTGFHGSRGEKASGVLGITRSDQKGKGQKRCV